MPLSRAVLEPGYAAAIHGSQQPTVKFLEMWGIDWHQIGSLKSSMMEVFTKKVANVTNQNFFAPESQSSCLMFTSTSLLLSQSSYRLTLEMSRLAEQHQGTFTMKEEKQSRLPDGFYKLRCETILTPGPRLKAFWRGRDKADPLRRLLLEARVFRSLGPCPAPLCLETQCWLSTEEACSEVPRHHPYLLVSFCTGPMPQSPGFPAKSSLHPLPPRATHQVSQPHLWHIQRSSPN